MKSSQEIIELFNTKEIDSEWAFDEYKPSQRSKWTHGYHRYPAKFIPQIVEKLIDEYINSKEEEVHINDPFFGCGTTITTAISRGFKASGTDINRIAYLITKVKATPIEPRYLERKLKVFLPKLKTLEHKLTTLIGQGRIEPLIPQRHLERIDYWFDEQNKQELGKILRTIHEEEEEEVIRDFLLVAFSHGLKNCSRWLQGSTKPTRDPNKTPANPYQTIKRHLRKMQRGNEAFYNVVPEKVRKNINNFLNIKIGDARKQPVEDNCVDLIVTSSPYVTSYEYADLHQLSTIWFDLAEDLRKYRENFIGTAHKSYTDKNLKGTIGRDIIHQLTEKDKKLARNAEAFFIDMQEVFNESYRILKKGGRCCYVIGDTKLKGVEILNAEVFAEKLAFSGFEFNRLIKREIHSKILPQKRDEKTGRFASNENADTEAYPVEYIVIGLKR